MKKEKFDIQGMTCSSCSSHVEKAVKKLDGVSTVSVNLLSNNMIVNYNENIINNEQIIQAVKEAGYGASLENLNNKKEDKKTRVNETIKNMKKRLIISICFLIPLMYLAMHNMLNEWVGLPIPKIVQNTFHGNENVLKFAITQFLILIPIIYINRNYFIIGFKRLFKGKPNMDSLIAIGSTASTVYGIFAIYMIWNGLAHNDLNIVERYSHDIYFESAGTILTLITLGKYLETKSKGKTSDAISKLINLAPKTATVIRDGKELEINTEEIVAGDVVAIKPGGNIPVDGKVIQGTTAVDQSSITGESIPVQKNVGDNVISGTINKNGYIQIEATKVGENTTLSQIIKLVEEASNSKAPISKIADKVSGVFVPAVIIIALITTIIWLLVGQSFEFTLTMGIAVLVISCPCALGLATPVAIMVGTGKGAENGILIKSAESLETLHLVDTVVLDKTGTITEGKPKVTDLVSNNQEELLKIAGSLEQNSEHPLALAIMDRVKEQLINIYEVKDFKATSGRGVKGTINGHIYFGGNLAYIEENNIDVNSITKECEEFLEEGKTVLYFSNESNIIGAIAVADTIKETSHRAIQELKSRNIKVVMITGDNKNVAETIGNKLEIDNVISEVLPQDKEKEVEKLQKQGKKVAFIGDGINDSPALVKADVGIAIGSGTDIAIESADVVLIKNSLLDSVNAIDLSRAVIKNIKMNLFWAFIYNIIGIPVATGVFYPSFGLKLNPMIGALAMSFSSVCVVTNALRLRKFKTNFKEEKNMSKKTIEIEGMQCNHCKMSVEKALNSIDGVTNVEVSLENKNATIDVDSSVENSKIKEVIEEAGFIVKTIS